MPSTVDCPACNRTLNVPDELLGKKVKCPSCGQTFLAGGESDEPRPSSRSTPVRRRDYDAEPPEEDYADERLPRRRRSFAHLKPHRGTMILVFGIIGLVAFQPLGIAAWIMGNNDLEEIRAGRMDPEGEAMTNAGRICGMIATILLIVSVVFLCLFIIAWLACFGALMTSVK